MAEESYYELLQVTPTADLEIITAAYRALIRRHHPDRNPSPNAEATTKLLNEAWEVLSDPTRRADYDRGLGVQTNRPAPPPRPPTRPTQETPPPNRPPPPPIASQLLGYLKDAFDTASLINGGLTLIKLVVMASILVAIGFFVSAVWAALSEM